MKTDFGTGQRKLTIIATNLCNVVLRWHALKYIQCSADSFELGLFTIDTSAPVFVGFSVAPRVAGIDNFKIAAEEEENVRNRSGSPTFAIVMALMGPHCFNRFWRSVKRWTSLMKDSSFFIINASRSRNEASNMPSPLKDIGHTEEGPVCGEVHFLKRSRWLHGKPFLHVCSTSNSLHSC